MYCEVVQSVGEGIEGSQYSARPPNSHCGIIPVLRFSCHYFVMLAFFTKCSVNGIFASRNVGHYRQEKGGHTAPEMSRPRKKQRLILNKPTKHNNAFTSKEKDFNVV